MKVVSVSAVDSEDLKLKSSVVVSANKTSVVVFISQIPVCATPVMGWERSSNVTP